MMKGEFTSFMMKKTSFKEFEKQMKHDCEEHYSCASCEWYYRNHNEYFRCFKEETLDYVKFRRCLNNEQI